MEDNQGTLRYVRVEFGGFPISPDNELNCIAFQGTGSGTTVEFVEALNGGDDGFEWFGGTVNARNIISVGAQDDSLDWTFGWTGMVQFAVVQQRADGSGVGDRAIEADNNETDFSLTPRSAPMFQNVTFIGDPDPTFSGSTQVSESPVARRASSGISSYRDSRTTVSASLIRLLTISTRRMRSTCRDSSSSTTRTVTTLPARRLPPSRAKASPRRRS